MKTSVLEVRQLISQQSKSTNYAVIHKTFCFLIYYYE